MKRLLWIWLLILVFVFVFVSGCGVGSQETTVRNEYTWITPGGTTINFHTENFDGIFYPERIQAVLGPMCQTRLVVDEVNVYITNAQGYNGNQPVNYEAGYGSTGTTRDSSRKIIEINVYIAGGGFETLKPHGSYTYPARAGHVTTSALYDLSGTIVEEVGVHVCRRTTHDENPHSEDLESENVHREFLLDPTVLFKPDW